MGQNVQFNGNNAYWHVGPMFYKVQESGVQKFKDSTTSWGIRKAAERVKIGHSENKVFQALFENKWLKAQGDEFVKQYKYLDNLMKDAPKDSSGAVKSAAAGAAAYSYAELLGLDKMEKVDWNDQKSVQKAKNLFKPKNMFGNAKTLLSEGGGSTGKNFFKKVVVGQNIKNMVRPLKEGKLLPAGLLAFAWGSIALGAFKAAGQEYDNCRVKGQGKIRSALNGVKAFFKKGIKSLISWEIAGFGYAFGAAAAVALGAATGGLAAIAAGIVTGAALGASANKFVLSKVLSDPDKQIK